MAGTLNPNERYPSPTDGDELISSHTQKGFRISTLKLPISKSGPIDDMSASLRIPVPEMIFGDNFVRIEHIATGWCIEFNAYDALDKVDKTGEGMLQVAHSGEWSKSREKTHEGIKEIVRPFDWTYSSDYKGTIRAEPTHSLLTPSTHSIPIELLKRPDPILFFEEVVLYESELDDNGVSIYSCKVRVMPERMLLLCRMFVRVDGVILRVRDTRIYVDFGARTVMRDYTEKEEAFQRVREKLLTSGTLPDDITTALRDANQVAHLLVEKQHTIETVTLPG